MLAALKEIIDLNSLLFIANHEDCPQCQKTGWVPSPNGRQAYHRHDEFCFRAVPLLGAVLREYCKDFKTDNDGILHAIIRGLQAEGVLPRSFHMPGASPVVTDSQQLNDQEPTLIEAKEESPKEETIQGPDLWEPLTEPLTVRVSEKNFEVWLSSVRFFSSDESRLVLHVPNTFFQEYLAEHYTEVIQEELQHLGTAREVVFEVGLTKEEPTPEPNKEDPPQEILPKEDLSTPELRKIAKRKADREQLQAQCYARIHGKYEFMVFKYIDELKLLKASEAEEDRIEAERERAAVKEAWRDQRATPSHFWSDEKTNRKKVRQLVAQLERDKVTETNKPKRE